MLLHVSFAEQTGRQGHRAVMRLIGNLGRLVQRSRHCFRGIYVTLDPAFIDGGKSAARLHASKSGVKLLRALKDELIVARDITKGFCSTLALPAPEVRIEVLPVPTTSNHA